jgi:hypothetical protein
MYVKTNDGNVLAYPYSIEKFKQENPSASANPTNEELATYGVFPVIDTPEPDYDKATERAVWGPPTVINGQWTHVWQTMPLTEEQKQNRLEAETNDVRNKRNKLLQESDWTQIADAPVDGASWRPYRQALRDITTQEGFPWGITWPTKPE